MVGFLQTIELYFNAICGIIAGTGSIISILIAIKQWRKKNEIAGAMFVAIAALLLMIGVCGMVVAIQILLQLRAAAAASGESNGKYVTPRVQVGAIKHRTEPHSSKRPGKSNSYLTGICQPRLASSATRFARRRRRAGCSVVQRTIIQQA